MKQGTSMFAGVRQGAQQGVRTSQRKAKQAQRAMSQWKGLWREATPGGRLGEQRQRAPQRVEVATRRYEEDAERWDGLS